jgi:hypothetical protein
VDGLLPGKTAEETIAFRDIVMRWELPHLNLYWETLDEGIASFGEQKPAHEHLLAYQTDKGPVYSLGSFLLEQFAQLVLAVKQVLDGLNDFLGRPFRNHFTVDPNWQLLRLMELNVSRNQILMVFATLQHRLRQSAKHIRKHLQSVQLVYGQEGLDLVSSWIRPEARSVLTSGATSRKLSSPSSLLVRTTGLSATPSMFRPEPE